MTREEAKEILLLYRPGTRDGEDPENARALTLLQMDPELKQWFEEHCRFQTAMRQSLRQAAPPAELRNSILARRKIVAIPAPRRGGIL